jgi:glycosyltransferase involved in cell wall biosynthesis
VRILWVKANKIFPVHSGGDLRSFHILQELARRHELTFLSYYDGAVDERYEREVEERLPGALCVCTGSRKDSTMARGLDYLAHARDDAPYAVGRFASAIVREELKQCLADPEPDVVVCDFLDAAINFPERLTAPSVLFQHNVESEIWRRHAETGTNGVKRLVYRREYMRMLAYEKAAVRKFQHVIAVSEHDRRLMSEWVDPARITVVPTGVDLAQYAPDNFGPEPGPLVMFTGAMDWEPNIDATEYFCRDIWPGVKTAVPAARLRVVGRNPGRRVQALASDSVEVTGRVASVVEHLKQAAVVVVPLRIGGGTRLKIYEAMAAEKAVISTSVGAEGLDVHDGRDIILADSAKAFRDSVVALLQDRDLRKRYERAAAELIAGCGWPAVTSKFEAVLQRVAGMAADVSEELAPVARN